MATSGSWDYSQTAAQIIQAAWEDLGILIPGGTIVPAHQTMALDRLNKLGKQWQGNSDLAPGLKIYSRQRVILLLAKGQQTYTVGPAATDSRASTAMGRTTVSSAYASGTSLSVTALTDTTTYPGTTITMTAADIIGVQLNDGTISYTTISAAASSPITLGGALASAAAAGNYVWWFTSRAQRFPLLEAAVLRYSTLTDAALDVYTDVRQYEIGVANKYADGAPSAILVEPLRLNTRITLNSQPTDVTSQIVLTVQYPAEDYDATSNDIAMPQEGYAALSWELAKRCASAMRVPWTQVMDDNHKTALALYRSLNPENSILYFQPNA
jgi:hypothetical protein